MQQLHPNRADLLLQLRHRLLIRLCGHQEFLLHRPQFFLINFLIGTQRDLINDEKLHRDHVGRQSFQQIALQIIDMDRFRSGRNHVAGYRLRIRLRFLPVWRAGFEHHHIVFDPRISGNDGLDL
ncbi:hypothetical protein D3C86_1818860 [compost metagenome]